MGKSYNYMVVVGVLVIVAVVLQCAAAQRVQVVGGSVGWVVPQNGEEFYDSWAETRRFMLGDILTFNFTTNEHDVLQVPEASYDACTSANPIGNLILTGPANITLNSTGDHYYICTFGNHCQLGQKLSISVSDSAASPSPSTNTPPASPPPTSGTPAPPSTPTADGPTTQTTPAPPPTTPGSSSSAVFASFFVTLSSIAIALFFLD